MIINHVSSRRGDQVAKDLKDQLERKEVGWVHVRSTQLQSSILNIKLIAHVLSNWYLTSSRVILARDFWHGKLLVI